MNTTNQESTSPVPRRNRRRWVWGCALLILGIGTATAYPRWGWYLESFAETAPIGPWRMPTEPITVLTFNIHTGDNLDNALKVIIAESPDVACLQEIRPSQMSHIERFLGMDGYWTPSSNLIGDAAWGNAIFVRGKLDQVQALTTPDGKSFGVWGSAETKGGRFIIGSVHFMHFERSNGGIPQRVREARAMMESIKSVNAPTIIAGDFNEPPIASFIRPMILEQMTDAAPACGPTLPSRVPLVRVDYVYCTMDWGATDGRALSTTASDHRPVVTNLWRASPR